MTILQLESGRKARAWRLSLDLDLDLGPWASHCCVLPRASSPSVGWGALFGTCGYGYATPRGREDRRAHLVAMPFSLQPRICWQREWRMLCWCIALPCWVDIYRVDRYSLYTHGHTRISKTSLAWCYPGQIWSCISARSASAPCARCPMKQDRIGRRRHWRSSGWFALIRELHCVLALGSANSQQQQIATSSNPIRPSLWLLVGKGDGLPASFPVSAPRTHCQYKQQSRAVFSFRRRGNEPSGPIST